MSKIVIDKFMGEAVGLTPRLIPDGYAQYATDCDVSRGTLSPIRNDSVSDNIFLSGARTIFRTRSNHWLAWDTDVDVVPSPIVDDVHYRHYWTGDGAPKMAGVDVLTSGVGPYPGASYTLGIPSPDTILAAAEPDRGEIPLTAVSTAYAYSYVSAYGEEGPLSDPSAIVTRWDDDVAGNISLTIPSVVAPGRNIDRVRIYRTESGGYYSMVAEIAAGIGSFTDDVSTSSLLGTNQTADWFPPNESMIGMSAGPGGSLMGFFGNTLCFSEPGYPHAWPASYRLAMDYDIVGIALVSQGVVVLTEGTPALVVGSSPSVMQKVEVDSQQPCIAKNSIVDMGEYVFYACPDGLAAISGGSAPTIITESFISAEAWRDTFYPEKIKAYRINERYVSFGTNADGTEINAFSFSAKRGLERYSTANFKASFYDPLANIVHCSVEGLGTLVAWQKAEARRTAEWRSKIYEISNGTALAFGKIKASGFPVFLDLYANGSLLITLTVTSGQEFRLPVFPAGTEEIEFSVRTTHEVFSVQMAQSVEEIV
ncbi:hypothetical protein [uncultured Amphritea sp.]|uniref:hypothetical protein n=1 Tax=uncultured Amphritea sp. TaxID=981605 RepID=UPI002617EF53|nr:hypothetical protein [uncultured Amphritea sp.]